jgi:nitroreductase
MDVIEAMETCSAARYLRPDPVPQDLIERVIYAATRASSPGNSQEWDFIVVRDPEAKRKIRDLLAPRFKEMRVGMPTTGQSTSRMIAGAISLAETLNEVPAIIFVCGPIAHVLSA